MDDTISPEPSRVDAQSVELGFLSTCPLGWFVMQLSVQDWESVAEAPVVVFVLIAFADRDLSDNEREAFYETWLPRLKKINIAPTEYMMELYQAGLGEATASLRPYTRCTTSELLERLAETFKVMRAQIRTSRVDDFRDSLMLLADEVAEASGGFPLLVDATSDFEAVMIDCVRVAMDGD